MDMRKNRRCGETETTRLRRSLSRKQVLRRRTGPEVAANTTLQVPCGGAGLRYVQQVRTVKHRATRALQMLDEPHSSRPGRRHFSPDPQHLSIRPGRRTPINHDCRIVWIAAATFREEIRGPAAAVSRSVPCSLRFSKHPSRRELAAGGLLVDRFSTGEGPGTPNEGITS